MDIYDGHCHIASHDLIPRHFTRDVAANMHRALSAAGSAPAPERLTDGLTAQQRDHLADGLVAEMDAAGVRRAVLLAPDFSLRMPGAPGPRETAARHHEVRRRHPGRFWFFTGVDPRHGEQGLTDFEQNVSQYGAEGVKLYPPCGYSPSDPALHPYYEICAARGMPVFVHTGPTAGSLDFTYADPIEVDRAARDFPAVDFVLGHGGITHVETAVALASHRRNVYLDIGGFAGAPLAGGWPAHLNRLFRSGVNHKVLFGTDWPLNRMSGGMNRLLEEIVDGPTVFDGVRRAERALIMGGNLLRILARVPDGSGGSGGSAPAAGGAT